MMCNEVKTKFCLTLLVDFGWTTNLRNHMPSLTAMHLGGGRREGWFGKQPQNQKTAHSAEVEKKIPPSAV